MLNRRDLLKLSGTLTTIFGVAALDRFGVLKGLSKAVDPSVAPELIVRIYPAGALSRSPQINQVIQESAHFLKVQSGGKILALIGNEQIELIKEIPEVSLTVSSPSLMKCDSKAMPFFSRLPQGLNQEEKRAWLTSEVGQRLWAQTYASMGLTPLYFGQGPATEYQMLSRLPEELRNTAVFATPNKESLRAVVSKRTLLPLKDYQQLLSSVQHAFISDGIPATTILEKNLHRSDLFHFVPTDFLTSSVFNLNIPTVQFNALSAQMKKLLAEVSLFGGDKLTSLLAQKESQAAQKLSLTHHSEWEKHDQKLSQRSYKGIVNANSTNREIARYYETFRTGLFKKS